jgi:hypothetical protein
VTFQPTALIPVAVAASPSLPACLAADLEKAADLARREKAHATRRAYRSDFELFSRLVCGSRNKRSAGHG